MQLGDLGQCAGIFQLFQGLLEREVEWGVPDEDVKIFVINVGDVERWTRAGINLSSKLCVPDTFGPHFIWDPIEYAISDVWTLDDLSLIFDLIHWQPCPGLPTEPGHLWMLCTPFCVNVLPWFNLDFSFEKRVLSLENVGLFCMTIGGKTLATPLGDTLVVNGGEGRRVSAKTLSSLGYCYHQDGNLTVDSVSSPMRRESQVCRSRRIEGETPRGIRLEWCTWKALRSESIMR